MMLGPKDTGAFTSSRKLPPAAMPAGALDLHRHVAGQPWPQSEAECPPPVCVALTIAASISSGFPHSGHTETGYHCWVSVTFFGLEQGAPRMAFLPTGLPAGRLALGLCMPDANWIPGGGTLLFVLFFMTGFLPLPSSATWDANSAIRASLTFISLSRTERIRSIRASSLSFSSRVLTRALLIFACTSSRSASSVESSSSQRPSSRRICLRRRESLPGLLRHSFQVLY